MQTYKDTYTYIKIDTNKSKKCSLTTNIKNNKNKITINLINEFDY